MATALEQVTEYQKKISDATAEIAARNISIELVKKSITDPVGCQPAYAWVEGGQPPPYTGPNATLCRNYYLSINNMVAANKAAADNITLWTKNINQLQNSPAIQQEIIMEEAKAKIKKLWTWAVVIVIVAGVLTFIWYKWIKK